MRTLVLNEIRSHQTAIEALAAQSVDTIIAAAERIIDCIRAGGTVYLCGNGGSAADAQHIAGEFVGRFRRERRALPAVALTTDTSVLTAVGNDYSYDDIFARQVEALVTAGDLLWALSTSGASTNVLAAARSAKQQGATVLGFTGKPGSELEQAADVCLSVEADATSTVQEVHQLAYHIICDLVEQGFTDAP
jgi:D-sedoheptulose 7-phosphate isomerase